MQKDSFPHLADTSQCPRGKKVLEEQEEEEEEEEEEKEEEEGEEEEGERGKNSCVLLINMCIILYYLKRRKN